MEEEVAEAPTPKARKVLRKAIAEYVESFGDFITSIGGGTWPPIDRSQS